MKYEIDIDLGLLADEWEPVAWRAPKRGEDFALIDGTIYKGEARVWSEPRLIVRRKWHWPEWLTAEWIAMDECGKWYAFQFEPTAEDVGWIRGGPICNLSLTSFSPPPCTDWRQSKRRNPRAK